MLPLSSRFLRGSASNNIVTDRCRNGGKRGIQYRSAEHFPLKRVRGDLPFVVIRLSGSLGNDSLRRARLPQRSLRIFFMSKSILARFEKSMPSLGGR